MAVVAAASIAAAAAAAAAAAPGEGTWLQADSEKGREAAGEGRESISQGAGCFAWLPDPRLLHASLDAAISAHGDAYVQVS